MQRTLSEKVSTLETSNSMREGPKGSLPYGNSGESGRPNQCGNAEKSLNGQSFNTSVITDKEFKQLAQYIKEHYGINLKEEKRTLVTGRLHNVLVQNGFSSFSQYFDYIISDKTGNAVVTMINKITTNYTFFMREADHFYFFRDKILPYLSSTVKTKDLRIWSAGCSSAKSLIRLQ